MKSAIAGWLSDHLASLSLSEEAEGYLLGRAATPESIKRLEFVEWAPAHVEAPSGQFKARYGSKGEALRGMLTYPLMAPSGRLLGFEARSMHQKKISEFRVPEAEWNPVFVNAPKTVKSLWGGGSVWVAEGVFDLLALELIVPEGDAVMSTLRAGISRRHVEFLSRFARNRVYMVYDNDETGRKATLGWKDPATGKYRSGAMDLLKRAGLRAIDFRYRGKDPGEVWSSGGIRKLRRVFLQETE